jgi:hypothetical protein
MLLLIGTLTTASLTAVDTSAKDWADLNPGDVVEFLLPAEGPQPDQASATDKLVISGGKLIVMDTTGCGGGNHPVQNYSLIDSTGKRSAKGGGIIPTLDAPIRPGTRLSDPGLDATCSINGEPYNRYQATVE